MCYWMIFESWESIQEIQNVHFFTQGIFCERLQVASIDAIAAKLMNVSGL